MSEQELTRSQKYVYAFVLGLLAGDLAYSLYRIFRPARTIGGNDHG